MFYTLLLLVINGFNRSQIHCYLDNLCIQQLFLYIKNKILEFMYMKLYNKFSYLELLVTIAFHLKSFLYHLLRMHSLHLMQLILLANSTTETITTITNQFLYKLISLFKKEKKVQNLDIMLLCIQL